LGSFKLIPKQSVPPSDPQFLARAAQHAQRIRFETSFRSEWFVSDAKSIDSLLRPSYPLDYPLPKDWVAAVSRTSGRREKEELQYLYNYNLVKDACASGTDAGQLAAFGREPGFVYTFDAPDKTEFPAIRFVPHWNLGAYTPNNFGFRGSDIAFPKPAGVVRIAFLGQSNTQNGWPNFVGLYLNKWARAIGLNVQFDVVNAGRAGVGTEGLLRIMRYEVASLRPDIVIVYLGAASLRATDVFSGAQRAEPRIEGATFAQLNEYSELSTRISQLRYGDLAEPTKPPHALEFDLSGTANFDEPGLPFRLNQEISDLRSIGQASREIQAGLFLTSSIVLARDGLRFDLARDYRLYNQLNGEYWPLTYQEVRQGADFQNRAYRALSIQDHLGFIDIDRYFPQDPAMFADIIHLRDGGMSLQAWIVAQALAPVIREKVAKSEWPTRSTAEPDEIDWVKETPKKFDLRSCQHKAVGSQKTE
jgi:hypothetical protein